MNSRINHKNIVTKKNRLSNLFYVRQAVASATFFILISDLLVLQVHMTLSFRNAFSNYFEAYEAAFSPAIFPEVRHHP